MALEYINPQGTLYHSGTQAYFVAPNKLSMPGEVIEANCTKEDSRLAALAEDAATRWQFTPTYVNGERVVVESQLTFHFSR